MCQSMSSSSAVPSGLSRSRSPSPVPTESARSDDEVEVTSEPEKKKGIFSLFDFSRGGNPAANKPQEMKELGFGSCSSPRISKTENFNKRESMERLTAAIESFVECSSSTTQQIIDIIERIQKAVNLGQIKLLDFNENYLILDMIKELKQLPFLEQNSEGEIRRFLCDLVIAATHKAPLLYFANTSAHTKSIDTIIKQARLKAAIIKRNKMIEKLNNMKERLHLARRVSSHLELELASNLFPWVYLSNLELFQLIESNILLINDLIRRIKRLEIRSIEDFPQDIENRFKRFERQFGV